MSENKLPEWQFKTHNYQIADTGDYDGYYELTNGTISLCTKDDDDETIRLLKFAANILNRAQINLYESNTEALSIDNYLLQQDNKQMREHIRELEIKLQNISSMPTLTQSRADFIREVNDRDMEGMEAIEFAEWAPTIAFFYDEYRLWELLKEGEFINGQFRFTTKELYELFKQQKDNP